MAYRRDNSEFRASIVRKADARKLATYEHELSLCQRIGFGLLVNVLKLWVILSGYFGR